jgi:hypothetical protein
MYKTIWVTGIVRLTLLAHLLTQLFLYKAWTTDRIFPTLTVFSFTKNLPKETPLFLYGATVLLTLVLLCKPLWKIGTGLWIGLVILSWVWDFVFWQPYTYCFLAIAVIHFFSRTSEQFWTRCLLLLSAMYTFSGLHKINGAFLYTVWDPYFLKKLFGISSTDSFFLILHYTGLLVGLIEILFGVGLLFQRSRLWAFRGLTAMHFLIILGLSPIGLFSNGVVVPWNLALFFINAMGCFAPKMSFFVNPWQLEFKKHVLFVLCFWIMPLFGYFGYYNRYFSFDVYSGKGESLYIIFEYYNDCPKPLTPFLYPRKIENKKYWIVSPTRWCKRELHLLLPNDEYVLHSFAAAYEKQFPNSKGQWYITSYPFTAEISHRIKMGNQSQDECIENLQKKR